jgi:hypothetical protein
MPTTHTTRNPLQVANIRACRFVMPTTHTTRNPLQVMPGRQRFRTARPQIRNRYASAISDIASSQIHPVHTGRKYAQINKHNFVAKFYADLICVVILENLCRPVIIRSTSLKPKPLLQLLRIVLFSFPWAWQSKLVPN